MHIILLIHPHQAFLCVRQCIGTRWIIVSKTNLFLILIELIVQEMHSIRYAVYPKLQLLVLYSSSLSKLSSINSYLCNSLEWEDLCINFSEKVSPCTPLPLLSPSSFSLFSFSFFYHFPFLIFWISTINSLISKPRFPNCYHRLLILSSRPSLSSSVSLSLSLYHPNLSLSPPVSIGMSMGINIIINIKI